MGSTGKKSDNNSFVGKSVDSLPLGFWEVKKQFNLDFATDAQIQVINNVIKGMREHDRGYGEDKTPYVIRQLDINRGKVYSDEEKQEMLDTFGNTVFKDSKVIYVNIETVPDTDNAYLRMLDTKYRFFCIGPKGGIYKVGAGKRKPVRSFDAEYGKRSILEW